MKQRYFESSWSPVDCDFSHRQSFTFTMKFAAILTAVVSAAGLVAAAPTGQPEDSKTVAPACLLESSLTPSRSCETSDCLPGTLQYPSAQPWLRRLTDDQNSYTCARSVDGIEKRVPCLPEDKAATEETGKQCPCMTRVNSGTANHPTAKEKRQIVYQVGRRMSTSTVIDGID